MLRKYSFRVECSETLYIDGVLFGFKFLKAKHDAIYNKEVWEDQPMLSVGNHGNPGPLPYEPDLFDEIELFMKAMRLSEPVIGWHYRVLPDRTALIQAWTGKRTYSFKVQNDMSQDIICLDETEVLES